MCYFQAYIYILDDPNWRIFFRNDGLPRICVNHWSTIIVWYQIQLQVKDNGYSLEPKESGRSTHCMDIMDMAQDESPKKNKVKYADISTLPNTDAKVWKGISRNWWNLQKMDGGHTQYIQSKMMKPPKIDVAIPQQKTMTIWTCSIFFYGVWRCPMVHRCPKMGGYPQIIQSSSHPYHFGRAKTQWFWLPGRRWSSRAIAWSVPPWPMPWTWSTRRRVQAKWGTVHSLW